MKKINFIALFCLPIIVEGASRLPPLPKKNVLHHHYTEQSEGDEFDVIAPNATTLSERRRAPHHVHPLEHGNSHAPSRAKLYLSEESAHAPSEQDFPFWTEDQDLPLVRHLDSERSKSRIEERDSPGHFDDSISGDPKLQNVRNGNSLYTSAVRLKERGSPHAVRRFIEAAEQFKNERNFKHASIAYRRAAEQHERAEYFERASVAYGKAAEQYENTQEFEHASIMYRKAASLADTTRYKEYLFKSACLLIEEVSNNPDKKTEKALSLLSDAQNAFMHLWYKNYKIFELMKKVDKIYTLKMRYEPDNDRSYEAFSTAYQNLQRSFSQMAKAATDFFTQTSAKAQNLRSSDDPAIKEILSANFREAGDLFAMAKRFSNAAKSYFNAAKLASNPATKKINLRLAKECYEILDDGENIKKTDDQLKEIAQLYPEEAARDERFMF